MRIGFVGLGGMGRPMVEHLRAAGHAVAGRLEPLFACIGKTVVRVGEAGAGQVAKACNQLFMVSVLEATAEAARLANAAGVDFAKVREAMLGGSASSTCLAGRWWRAIFPPASRRACCACWNAPPVPLSTRGVHHEQ